MKLEYTNGILSVHGKGECTIEIQNLTIGENKKVPVNCERTATNVDVQYYNTNGLYRVIVLDDLENVPYYFNKDQYQIRVRTANEQSDRVKIVVDSEISLPAGRICFRLENQEDPIYHFIFPEIEKGTSNFLIYNPKCNLIFETEAYIAEDGSEKDYGLRINRF